MTVSNIFSVGSCVWNHDFSLWNKVGAGFQFLLFVSIGLDRKTTIEMNLLNGMLGRAIRNFACFDQCFAHFLYYLAATYVCHCKTGCSKDADKDGCAHVG
jgi:hypothetical protein